MNHRIAALAALVLLAAVVSAGCKKGETLGTVTGNVTFQGKPVTEGMVMFVGPGVHMTAKLDAQGHYEVKQAKGAGLPPGSYQVSVNPPVIDAPMAGGNRRCQNPHVPQHPAPLPRPQVQRPDAHRDRKGKHPGHRHEAVVLTATRLGRN